MTLALARQQLKDTIMMQRIPQTLHLGNDTAPRTKPPRATTALSNITVARLNMPVVLKLMRRVLQSASLCAIFLMLLAQNAIELAITPINALSHLKISAAKAQLPRSSQRTRYRAHMCPRRLHRLMTSLNPLLNRKSSSASLKKMPSSKCTGLVLTLLRLPSPLSYYMRTTGMSAMSRSELAKFHSGNYGGSNSADELLRRAMKFALYAFRILSRKQVWAQYIPKPFT